MQTPSEYQVIEISEQPIALCQLLKIANLVSGGGEAKIVISEGYVLLNNEVEYQKRKKIYEHDIVEFNGEMIQVALNTKMVRDLPPKSNSKLEKSLNAGSDKKKKKTKGSPAIQIDNKDLVIPNKRKPISF